MCITSVTATYGFYLLHIVEYLGYFRGCFRAMFPWIHVLKKNQPFICINVNLPKSPEGIRDSHHLEQISDFKALTFTVG